VLRHLAVGQTGERRVSGGRLGCPEGSGFRVAVERAAPAPAGGVSRRAKRGVAGRRLHEDRPITPGLFRLPLTLDCTETVQVLTSSSRTLDVGLQKERPSFNCFHKIIIEESATATADNNDNEMSSGAAASGRGGDGRPAR